jgi:hypothetical protein
MMRGLLILIPLLACPVGMVVMAWGGARWARLTRPARPAAVTGLHQTEEDAR